MSSSDSLIEELNLMKSALQTSLTEVKNGAVVDISRLPDKLVKLHKQVEVMEEPNKAGMASILEELLLLLDQLAKEIHKKYEDVSNQIRLLEGTPD